MIRQAAAPHGDDAGAEPAANGSEAVAAPPSPALDKEFHPSEQAADGGAAAPLHAAPDDSAKELPAAFVKQAASVGHSATHGEPADLEPAGELFSGKLLSGVDSRPTAATHQEQPSTADPAPLDAAVEPAQEPIQPDSAASLEASPPEAADAVSQRHQDVDRPTGTGTAAPDRSSALSAAHATEQAAVRQDVQVPDFAERPACALNAQMCKTVLFSTSVARHNPLSCCVLLPIIMSVSVTCLIIFAGHHNGRWRRRA